ncbi:MAG: site-specific integrase [Deltaproteobacteria bacterium]|nr:site-specific integrase [Deltaproteobacteria bacterium]
MTHVTTRWSFSTGERGRNRVRAFEHPQTGRIFLELYEDGRRKRIALQHRDREAAKAKAEEVAMALRRQEPPLGAALQLQTLFDNYLREVTPQKSVSSQSHDRRAANLFLELFGPDRQVATLNRRDWDAFMRRRRAGSDGRAGRVHGKPVGDRVITQNLKFLHAVLNWATMAGDGTGRYLLERNPLKGFPFPKESNPSRPIVTDEQYRAMLAIGGHVSPLFKLALILAHETGHRIGSIRRLRWSDMDFEHGKIRWRAENDKIGFEHETVVTEAALDALERARQEQQSIGDAWVFPSPGNPAEPCSRHLVRDWWQRAEASAGVPRVKGLGWHSLRRKFATELKHTPLKDLCYLGGWKEPQTVLKCYQRADEGTMREALASRKRLTGFTRI